MLFLRRTLIGVLLLALSVGTLSWAGASVWQAISAMLNEEARARPNREIVLAVNVAEVRAGEEVPVLKTFGEMRSHRSLLVRASASGRLIEISPSFEEGGTVKEGELLVRVDPSEAQAAVALAEADLADAEAGLREAIVAVSLAEDDLSVSREQVVLREQALSRQNDLSARGVGSVSAVEVAALSAASARQAVVSRRQALAQAQAREDQAQTGLDRMRVALTEAERLLSETEIRAKFSGTLSDVTLIEGGLVSRNEQLAQLVDPSALDVAFRLSTAQYARLLDPQGNLRQAMVDVVLDVAGLQLSAKGRIEREAPVVAEGQTGRRVFARLENAPGLRAGDIVTVQIREPELQGVARLPARAVDSAGTVLIIGEDDRLIEAPVELVRVQGDEVLVRAPDLEGRAVVAERTPLLGAGIKVRPLSPPSDPDSPQIAAAPEPTMVALTPERRAELIAFVESNKRMPADARKRVLGLLAQDEVPSRVVERLEGRMGG